MSMEKLSAAIGQIDDKLIIQARTTAKRRKIQQTTSAVAAILILVTAITMLPHTNKRQPSTSIDPLPAIEGTIQITNHIEPKFPCQGYAGNIAATESDMIASCPIQQGMAVTAKATQVIPGTYYYVDTKFNRKFTVVQMETIRTLDGLNMPEEFYFLFPTYYKNDLTEYDCLILRWLKQCSLENQVLCNEETGQFEVFELPLFTTYHILGFNEDICIGSIPEYEYEKETGNTLTQTETNVISQMTEHHYYPEVYSAYSLSDLTTPEAIKAKETIFSCENGTFIQELNRYYFYGSGISVRYRKYVNGYPTNETISISGDKVTYSYSQFVESENLSLPDLASGLMAVNEAYQKGVIVPPHIKDFTDLTLKDYYINGWYAKTDTEVLAIIRVSWKYEHESFFETDKLDDQYYLVMSDQVIPIDRDDLISKLGNHNKDYIYEGEYYEEGKLYPLLPVC